MKMMNNKVEAMEVNMMRKLYENLSVVKGYLLKQGIFFLSDENKQEGLINVLFADVDFTFRVTDELVDMKICDHREVTQETYPEVAAYLNKVNLMLKEGYFEVEQGKGVIFRVVFAIERGKTLQPSQVEELMERGKVMGDIFMYDVYKIMDGETCADEAFERTWELVFSAGQDA